MFPRWVSLPVDSRQYSLRGVALVTRFAQGRGPGYGLLLAAVETLTGSDLVAPVILNLLLGSLAPVLVYLLARELFENRAIAPIAGTIGTLSLTSIALSSQILSDQPFFTIHAGALLAFVKGIKSTRIHWFLAAGTLGAWGACVKSVGEPWIYLFVAIILLMPRPPAFAPDFIS